MFQATNESVFELEKIWMTCRRCDAKQSNDSWPLPFCANRTNQPMVSSVMRYKLSIEVFDESIRPIPLLWPYAKVIVRSFD